MIEYRIISNKGKLFCHTNCAGKAVRVIRSLRKDNPGKQYIMQTRNIKVGGKATRWEDV